jgi:para-nitrobenzyl esterase
MNSSPSSRSCLFVLAINTTLLFACGDGGDDDALEVTDGDASIQTVPDASDDAALEDLGELTIQLESGIVEGNLDGEARRFLAIPYAKPPVGELRFKAPEPAEPWSGVRHETRFPASCPQLADQGAPASMIEDCLYLNVWAPPAGVSDAPVMVWIHGGGNFSGGSGIPIPNTSELWYNGRVFAERQGVVLISIQYRLGPLGFNAHPALADEGEPLGNQGLRDQRLALEWVRDNVARFGGDPDNVTIFGESAGSADVCYHVVSPLSRGLFHRAISQSGGCTIRSTGAEAAAATAGEGMVAYGEALGCPAGADQLACLRDASVEDILGSAMQPDPGSGEVAMATWRFGAVIDGEGGFLPDAPRALFDAGDVAQVPYLLGANHDEGTTFTWRSEAITTEEAYLADLEARFGDAAADVAALYPASDFGDSYNAARARAVGDSGLVCGTHDTARRAAAAGLSVFMYDFEYPWALLPTILLAGHAAEISHVFGTPYLPTPDAASALLGDRMNAYWAAFARSGDPNFDDAPLAWPAFTADDDVRAHLTSQLAVLTDFRAEECAFWRAYAGAED